MLPSFCLALHNSGSLKPLFQGAPAVSFSILVCPSKICSVTLLLLFEISLLLLNLWTSSVGPQAAGIPLALRVLLVRLESACLLTQVAQFALIASVVQPLLTAQAGNRMASEIKALDNFEAIFGATTQAFLGYLGLVVASPPPPLQVLRGPVQLSRLHRLWCPKAPLPRELLLSVPLLLAVEALARKASGRSELATHRFVAPERFD